MDSGAHYFKTDLQVHTPRDPRWDGTHPTDESDRKRYADDFVAACRAKDLQAVAVTDHHDFTFVDYIRDAATREPKPGGGTFDASDQLVVFPGLELTLPDPCQALLIFSADFPTEHLATVLATLSVDPAPAEEATSKNPEQLAVNLKELHDRLDEKRWLRGQYIVLPNVTDSGNQTLMRARLRKPYIEMPCVGGYIDGGKAIGDGNKNIFAGEDPNWGNKRIAVVRTSDARDEKFQKLGTHPTWIKWARPTAEALRQACLADESRISLKAPSLPEIVLSKLSVSNSKFMGPVDLEFNPQYNALIGGRGTGKSTCLEYLRWALCDIQKTDPGEDETGDMPARRVRLIEQTLEPFRGQVEVSFLLNGTPHLVRRYSENGEVMLKIGDAELAPAAPEDIQTLLPIEAYSQKQLSSVGVKETELTKFVTAPLRASLEALTYDSDEVATKVRENFVRLRRGLKLSQAIARQSLQRESINQRVLSVRDELHGLSAEDRKTLAKKSKFDLAGQVRDSWVARLDQARDVAEKALTGISAAKLGMRPKPEDADVAMPEALTSLEEEVRRVLDDAETRARDLLATVDGAKMAGSPSQEAINALEVGVARFSREYDEARGRSTAEQSKLQELQDLEQQQAEIVSSLEHQEEEAAQYEDAATEHSSLLEQWRGIRSIGVGLIKGQCEELTVLSGNRIRASLEVDAGLKEFAARFKKLISGSNVRGNKVDEFFVGITSSTDPLVAWHAALESLQEILIAEESEAEWELPATELSKFTKSDLTKIASVVTPEDILQLELLVPQNIPSFEYQTKEDQYIAFADASAGQQATALLHVLLNQEGPPLVIDQPEDDLDSQVILEIVEQIWEAKRRRQLIFSSHNANLVVNGDAELVACCDYRTQGDHSGGRIKFMGAIDIEDVRNEITSVMEGGERAFKLRKEKYGF
jgi:type III restriction enzyme